ncbi:MAG: glycosyltransferase family 1 protein [Gammaproteobacteria bacterium]|nr:glycosyltransferase family 1 protein [Gammaproteobacteria bacterium]
MKIGLNATCFNDRPSGAKQRFVGIYTELFRHLSTDDFVVYEPSDCRMQSWFDNAQNVVFKQTPLSSQSRLKKHLGGLRFWPAALKGEKFDLFESFHLPLVKAPSGRTILTIHDIRGVMMGGGWRERLVYKMILEKALKAADHVVTVSDAVRNEILEHYPNTSISVIYNGIDIELFQNIPAAESLKVQQEYGLAANFLLAVGHIEKRKNYIGLIDALENLHRRGRLIHLVIVGNDSGESAVVQQRVNDLKLSNYVKILNGLTDEEVRCIYSLCELFIFPSVYEGFGIPILEAMSAKRPIVLSDIPVFQEITQGQVAYFSHDSADSIASAVEKVLLSTEERNRLIQYGDTRVQDFSFKKIALNLSRVYQSLS